MIGQHKRNLNLVPYQPAWVDFYEKEAVLLRHALGEKLLAIEHIGSTSIGIPAKPIIDIMVGVASIEQAMELVPTV